VNFDGRHFTVVDVSLRKWEINRGASTNPSTYWLAVLHASMHLT